MNKTAFLLSSLAAVWVLGTQLALCQEQMPKPVKVTFPPGPIGLCFASPSKLQLPAK